MIKKTLILYLAKFCEIFANKKFNLKILMFHNIEKNNFSYLERILNDLKRKYKFIDPENLTNVSGKNNILLTFDDGFESNYFFSKNVLEKLKIKAIFFIVSDLVNKKNVSGIVKKINKNFDEEIDKLMSITQIKDLLSLGHKIGAHGKTHERLSDIKDSKKLNDEIVRPKVYFNEIFNVKTEYFAYPYGDIDSINENSIQLIRSHYAHLFTGIRGDNCKLNFEKNIYFRDNIICNYPQPVFNFFLKGFIDKFYYFKQKKILTIS